jgi:lysophospholipase L1-like esterase
MPPTARATTTTIPARFRVRAVSRHPRIGRDYSPVSHTYSEAYVNPRTYAVTVDAFPGKTVTSVPDKLMGNVVIELLLDKAVTGWRFSIEGRPNRRFPVGPQPPLFRASVETRLLSRAGRFNEGRDDNVWNWRVEVPGEGTYTVTVETLGSGVVRTHTLNIRDLLVVSIGDSAASGQGNPDIPGQPEGFDPDIAWWEIFILPIAAYKLTREALDWTWNKIKKEATTLSRAGGLTIDMDPVPVWLEPQAYRSLRSGAARAAKLLEEPDTGTVITFLPFGRTGSEIEDGLLGPRTVNGRAIDAWIDNIGQAEEVRRTVGQKQIDALLIQIGVNDVGVAGTLKQLIKGDNRILGDVGGSDTANRKAVETAGTAAIAALPAKFQTLAAAIAELNVRHVYLIEYPTGLFDGKDKKPKGGCGVFSSEVDLDLTLRDAELVKKLATDLNTALQVQAAALTWRYVTGIAADFEGHGYCLGPDDRFFVQAEESMGLQGDTEGTIHPNPAGTAAIAERIRRAVKRGTVDAVDGGGVIGTTDGVITTKKTTAATRKRPVPTPTPAKKPTAATKKSTARRPSPTKNATPRP